MRIKNIVWGGGHLLGTRGRRSLARQLGWQPAAVAASVAMAGLLVAMIFPALPEGAHAEEPATATPRVIEEPTVSLSVPAAIEFADVMATPSGATTTASAEIEVTTTASAGYKLYVYAEDNALKSLNPQTQQTIAATTQTSGVEELANNTWGYNLSEGTTAGTAFAELPTSDATPAAEKDTSATGGATGDIYTLALGAKVDSTMPSGTYTATMTVAAVADPAGVVVTYDANGGYFNGDTGWTSDPIAYTVVPGNNPETKIAKTSNISDDGTQSGGYGDNVETTETVTISGAPSLEVTVTYQTESTSYDWLAIYDGSVTPSATNYGESITGKLGGSTKVTNAVFTIPGDTAQFYFKSDGSSSNYYGYYAVVRESPTIETSSEVMTPTRPGYVFWGWYKDAAGSWKNEFEVTPSIQSGTVYAKWLLDVGPIQNYTSAQCAAQASTTEVVATDSRGGVDNVYSLRYINGTCWMTTNLRVASGTQLTSVDSNLPDGTTYTIPSADLTSGNSYTEGRVHAGEASNGESATDTGYWYNYCAASAGQVCSQTQMDATQDICPKGWSLPNKDQIDGLGGTTYLSAFAPVTGGYYNDGTLNNAVNGYWWSSTANASGSQYYLYYNGSLLNTNHLGYKYYGYYVRCVRSS